MNEPRIDALVAQLQERDWDAAFLCTANTLGYFTGAFEDGHERFLVLGVHASGQVRGIVPALSVTQFERHGVSQLLGWSDDQSPQPLFEAVADEWDLRRAVIGVENPMRADHLLMMQETLPAAKFHPADPAVSALRSVKSDDEIAALREAGEFTDRVFDQVVGQIRVGMTERQVEALIRGQFTELGVTSTFCIVAAGPNSAEPHHLSDDTVLQSGSMLLLDFGCHVRGYQADITRCVHLGPASPKAKETYARVAEAYHAALNAVKPGATGAQVDAAARGVLATYGLADRFIHRTGHGIGLDGHETPNISSKDTGPLVPGNTFSIEPGVYFPGEFGVRLENIVACGVAGHDGVSLNAPFSDELNEI